MEKENTWSGVNFLHTYWNRLKHHFDILSHKSIVVVVASYRNSNWNTIREEKHRRALMKIFFTINEYSNSLLYFCSTAQIYKIIDINTYKIYIYIYKYIYWICECFTRIQKRVKYEDGKWEIVSRAFHPYKSIHIPQMLLHFNWLLASVSILSLK